MASSRVPDQRAATRSSASIKPETVNMSHEHLAPKRQFKLPKVNPNTLTHVSQKDDIQKADVDEADILTPRDCTIEEWALELFVSES